MPWTETARREYARRASRYSSDLRDREWRLIEPFLPAARRLGRPRSADLREVMNAILYMASSGCAWSLLPKDFPPSSTVQRYFYAWRDSGLLRRINHHLVAAARDLEGREASPTAGVIDSQSVKTTESGRLRGFDAGKKINGRKRHILTDTLGLMVGLVVHSAGIQDRDGAPRCCDPSAIAIPGCATSSPMAATAVKSSAGGYARSASGRSRSSNEPIKRRALSSCRGVGSSSEPSLSSGDADDWPRTSKPRSPAPRPG